jgi:hypothetical protein
MARMTTTTQKKNTTIAGMAYPATVLALVTAGSYPKRPHLFCGALPALTGALAAERDHQG